MDTGKVRERYTFIYRKIDFFKMCCWMFSSCSFSGAFMMMGSWGETELRVDELWLICLCSDHQGAGRQRMPIFKHAIASQRKNQLFLGDKLYAKNLVNVSGERVGNKAFWLPVFRSIRTFTPVTCPWATWYFLWSMNRSRNRKIYACCSGNSACCWSVCHCAVSITLPWAFSIWVQISCLSPAVNCEETFEPSFLAFPSKFLSSFF